MSRRLENCKRKYRAFFSISGHFNPKFLNNPQSIIGFAALRIVNPTFLQVAQLPPFVGYAVVISILPLGRFEL